MFGGNHPSSTLRSVQGIATIPEFLWELSLAVYCTWKGFKASPAPSTRFVAPA
jgi:hypothetical protein